MRWSVEKGDVLGWTLSTGDPSNIPTEFTSVYPACAPSAIPTELKSVEPKRENIDKTYFDTRNDLPQKLSNDPSYDPRDDLTCVPYTEPCISIRDSHIDKLTWIPRKSP